MNKSNERYGNEQKNAELVLPRKVQNVQIKLMMSKKLNTQN